MPEKPTGKVHFFDKARNVRLVLGLLFGSCAGLLLMDLVYARHTERGFEGWFGFYGFYGFVACVVLVLAAKEMRKAVMRKEDHYDG